MEEGTYIRSQPANFARESSPASRLVKILLKDYIQYKRAIYKRQKGKNTLTQTYLKKRNHSETNRGDRGEKREGRHAHSSKANSEPKKTVVQPTKATEGEQREGRHTLKQKKESQEDHSTANKGDRGRHTRTTLRRTEMKRVTNDLTNKAIGSPWSLEKMAPAPREIEGQATLYTSDKTLYGTWRFGPKRIVIPLIMTPDKNLSKDRRHEEHTTAHH